LFASQKLLIDDRGNDKFAFFTPLAYRRFLAILLIVSGYFVPVFEIAYQIDAYYEYYRLPDIAIAFYTYLYISGILFWTVKTESNFFKNAFTWISVFMLLFYAFIVHLDFQRIIFAYLRGSTENTFVFIHFFTVFFVLSMAYFSWKNFFAKNEKLANIFLWINIILSVYILSYELDYLVLYISKPEFTQAGSLTLSVHKIGWPILWGILAFVLMIFGMRAKMRNLRIISLSLFFFTLLKLFAVDVWDMSEGGRIAAFISLGIILLVVSFLYQKLKKLIFEEEED